MQQYWQNADWQPEISIDTRNYQIAKKVVKYGVNYINVVSGLEEPKMCSLIAEAKLYAVYMHNLGIPVDKSNIIKKNLNPVQEILSWAIERREKILQYGIKEDKLIFDPGIGFGKDAVQSLQVLQHINKFHSIDLPILVGHSRKSFLNIFTDQPFRERDSETAIVSEFLARKNIQYLRVHNIEQNLKNLYMQAMLI